MKKKGKWILIVDDEPLICDLIQKMLEEDGYDVDSSSSAEIAFEKMKKKEYDIVLFDYLMPGKNGLTFIREANWNKKKTKMVLITGHVSHELIGNVFEEGASSYLIKPFNRNELLSALSHHLKNNGAD